MKKIILTAAAIFAFGFANAQDMKENKGEGFSKGDVFVTGALEISSEKTGATKDNTFKFEPQLGFFVTENIALGAKIGIGSQKQKVGSITTIDNSSFTGGVFGKYYFTPASKFSLFTNLGIDLTSTKNKLTNFKEKGVEVGLGAGLNYFISNNFAIEAGIGVLSFASNDNGGSGSKTNTFEFGSDWRAVTIGVSYKL